MVIIVIVSYDCISPRIPLPLPPEGMNMVSVSWFVKDLIEQNLYACSDDDDPGILQQCAQILDIMISYNF